MFLENVSRYSYDETFDKLSEKIQSLGNWKIQHIHDMQETLRKNGKEVLPIKVIELCNPKYSGRILEHDMERKYSVNPVFLCISIDYLSKTPKTFGVVS
ncbi:DUF302 domain-containing protein [Bacteroides sp. 51]|nr:DUF302 domain-containing protein [Bacteroides sp. 51]